MPFILQTVTIEDLIVQGEPFIHVKELKSAYQTQDVFQIFNLKRSLSLCTASTLQTCNGEKQFCKSSSTHTQHLALQPYFSHPRYLVIPSPTHKHEPGTVKGQNLLITIHPDESIHLTNQELVFNCAPAFASLSILSKNAEP
jgi:hypothetical protein